MTVYVDPLKDYAGRKGQWCHCISDLPGLGGRRELHALAKRLGVSRRYFNNHKRHFHYDLRSGDRHNAVAFGVVEVETRDLVRISHGEMYPGRLMLRFTDGREAPAPQKCESGCLTHLGPHWWWYDAQWAVSNREAFLPGNPSGFAASEQQRLADKLYAMKSQGIAEVYRLPWNSPEVKRGE